MFYQFYDGICINPVAETQLKCDIHCPDIGTEGINFYSSQCQLRQRDPQQKTCFGGCKHKHATKWKNTPTPPEKVAEIYDMIDAGATYADVCDAVGVSKSTITKLLRERRNEFRRDTRGSGGRDRRNTRQKE